MKDNQDIDLREVEFVNRKISVTWMIIEGLAFTATAVVWVLAYALA